jgi:hypothetical protein
VTIRKREAGIPSRGAGIADDEFLNAMGDAGGRRSGGLAADGCGSTLRFLGRFSSAGLLHGARS